LKCNRQHGFNPFDYLQNLQYALRFAFAALGILASLPIVRAESLDNMFQHPPASARPWVYWFWNNGNVTSNGITADLEAMRRAGIGGALLMDVAVERYGAVEHCGPPRGTAEFMNPEWQSLFQFSVQEAARLGLEINVNNGPGWTGSSGPWITPELSMQHLVWTNFTVTGPTNFSAVLPLPDTSAKYAISLSAKVQYADFYHDVALLAFPETTNGIVPRDAVADLSAKLGDGGKIVWNVPPGQWIIQRIGCTTTGATTRPTVVGGNGLECDKLSREAMDAQFAGMMATLLKTAGPLAGKTLAATHIDSWEAGAQNWTPRLREEFLKRRGYDLLPWLPCLTDVAYKKASGKNANNPPAAVYLRNLESRAAADRFRWDFNQTIAELLAENYSGRMAELARKHHLRFSLEGYQLPFADEFAYTAPAGEPMTEFWTCNPFNPGNTSEHTMRTLEMASVAHVYGRPILGAEAFTSVGMEQWRQTPATIKTLGDFALCLGVNRFVFHRFAHQPYPDRAPGSTMGPWGLHYERTQTWWEMSRPWHEYLARCQFLLRQGKFAADLLYLRPEIPDQTYTSFKPNPQPPAGYHYDEISAEALIGRVTVKNGRLVLPDGMSYRVLALPDQKAMTPALLEKIRGLTQAGATVLATGPRPQSSPGLQDFPRCDDAAAKSGREIWGDCDGVKVTEHALGHGRLIWGQPLKKVLADLNVPADFRSDTPLNWTHRVSGKNEIYFIANPSKEPRAAVCSFRANGRQPELWDPETGKRRDLPDFSETTGGTVVPLRFEPAQSLFVVFRKSAAAAAGKSNFPGYQTIAQITGPWELRFPPKWGAPESVILTNLASWSDSDDEGVKHFSGTAAYRAAFDLADAKQKAGNTKLFLSLGNVQVMARVMVNGRDCGIAWIWKSKWPTCGPTA
jgi:hypothetical protein